MDDIISSDPISLSDLDQATDSTAQTFKALIGKNLGSLTLKFSLPIKQFIDISAIGNRQNIKNIEGMKDEFHAQRNLIREHAVGLARYTLMGLVRSYIKDLENQGKQIVEEINTIKKNLGDPPYASLQPLVTNIRNYDPRSNNIPINVIKNHLGQSTGVYDVTLSQKHLMWVVDGQHRREGFEIVLEFLRKVTRNYKYPKKGIFDPHQDLISDTTQVFWLSILEMALSNSTVAIECHLGLTEQEEQQLFYDLNSKGRKVVASLAYEYDHTDAINKFVSKKLIEEELLSFKVSSSDQSDWGKDDGSISRKDVNNITSLLCLGKTSSKTSTPQIVLDRSDYLIKFWESICKVDSFGSAGAKMNTVLAQPVVIKSLAKLSFDLGYGHQQIKDKDALGKLFKSLRSGEIDFSHSNPLWKALFMSNDQRSEEFPGIEKYVFVSEDINLDAGTYDDINGWVRFGNRHNDIFPRLGDVIRFVVGINPRPSVTKAINEHAQA